MNYYYFKNATQPKVISTSFSDEFDTIAFDLTSVYLVQSLVSFTRINTYHRTTGFQSVVIQDRVKFSSPTSYEFGIPSKNGIWTQISATSNLLIGKVTVGSTSVFVRIQSSNPFTYNAVTKTNLGISYMRLGVSMVNQIVEDTITITYTN